MKPVNIVILVLAGAIGGAVIMKVAQRPKVKTAAVEAPAASAPVAVPVPDVAQPAPAPVPAQPVAASAPAPEAQPAPESQPETPAAPARKAAKPAAVHHAAPKPAPPYSRPSPFDKPKAPPAEVAQAAPPERVAQPAPAAPAQSPVAPAPAARPEPEPAPPAPAPQPSANSVTLNAGILFQVRLVDGLSSDRNQPGDAFMGTLDRELVADGFVIAERGARVEGRVVTVDRGTKTHGGATLAVELTRLRTSDNQNVGIRTDSFEKRSEPNRTTDAEKVGGGAAIGAIAGGGKGAAIGAGVGGGAGAGDVLLTRKPAALPSETRITFRLSAPVTLTERMGG